MGRSAVAAAFQVVLGGFLAAPAGFVLAGLLAPPDVYSQIAYGIPLVLGCAAVGGYAAHRADVDPGRIAVAIVTLYIASFVALVVLETLALATVGWLGGPWADPIALAVGALCAYWLSFRRG